MQNLLNDLTRLLEQDNRLVEEGKLLKNKVVELALALDPSLIKQLLKHDTIRKHFFVEVEGVLVFDKIKFQRFVSNKQFLPDSYTAFKNKIGLTANGEYLTESKEVVLSWPYKDCVLEGGQDKEDAKRNEVFWNETLAPDQIDRLLSPKVLTNFKRYDKDGEHPVSNLSLNNNLIIKGNNLLSLHTLKKVYAGKVKLIYIDPPYNTGTDSFKYNDNFNHSTWLTFMRNRLDISQGLIRDDGAIFISCDDNEQAYLKVLCDEIFGRQNFISCFAIIRSEGGGLAKQVVKGHDYLFVYAKNIELFNPLRKAKDIRGKLTERMGRKYWIEEDWLRKEFGKYGTCHYEEILKIKGEKKKIEIDEGIEKGIYQLIKKSNGLHVVGRLRLIEEDGSKFYSVLKHLNADAKSELEQLDLNEGFPYPKPVSLLKEIISGATFYSKNEHDIILDFFGGSGTTAHAVLELNKEDRGNRKFILCEQMHYVETVTRERVRKVIENNSEGSFVFCELSQVNQVFVDQIQAAQSSEDLQAIWQAMQARAFLSYKLNPKTIDANIGEFERLAFADQQRFLMEVLDKNLLYVPYSEIDDASYAVSEEDKKLNRQFFNL